MECAGLEGGGFGFWLASAMTCDPELVPSCFLIRNKELSPSLEIWVLIVAQSLSSTSTWAGTAVIALAASAGNRDSV